ncbi:MAG: sensor histidine kinase [Sarcina sp.]
MEELKNNITKLNKNHEKHFLPIRIIFLILALGNLKSTNSNTFNLLLISTISLLILLEFLNLKFYKKQKLYFFTMLLIIFISSIALISFQGVLYSYFIFLLLELIPNKFDKTKFILLGFQIIALIISEIISIIFHPNLFFVSFTPIVTYIGIIFIVTLIRIRKKDKKTIYTLNKELKEQNLKLQEYSLKIEELTLEKERTRVAQELHDNLGHYLMAISMHLDFLEKTIETSPENSLRTIDKTKIIVKNSITELRKTVYELKENKIDSSLNDAINSLIHNFSIGTSVKFNLFCSNLIENFNPNLKNTIYKTIKESLTNGVKHGEAKSFNISIIVLNNYINLTIKNHGKSGNNIIMSNGLKGIKERIESENGLVNFSYHKQGFLLASLIAVKNIKEGETYDKNYIS